ncbi:MAG: tryptophanyl-tRNA synthetase [Blastocatellia bacterium]|jgi:tryptophanyl-tRNA synthetase|nr:tryptophanyl-tRNA synthetase [Blastocatellia bacterium]
MKRIFSGAQPTGNVHLGNYLGALRNWVALQREYESFFCIVNLHAITVPQDPQELAAKTRDLARIYLAVGIDPELSTVFVQSDVPQHTELTWLLNGVTRMSELERMTQYKDKARNQKENVLVGLFDYPVLMAADILLYQTDLVPVGEDQKQHLELTRDIAIRFNRDFGETFRVPDPFIPKVGARIMSLADPAKKMSKSDAESEAGCIMLMDEDDAVRRKFKRAVTDSGTEIRFDQNRPAINNLLTIYHLLTGKSDQEIESHFAGNGYGKLKEELADVTIEFLKPFQERVRAIDDVKLDEILERGATRAESIAKRTMSQAKVNMGIVGAKNV